MEQIHLQPVENPKPEQVDASRRKLQPVEKPMLESTLLAGAVAHGEEPPQQQVSWQNQQLMGRTHGGTVHEGIYPVEGTSNRGRGRV